MNTPAVSPKLYIWFGEMLFLGTSEIPYREHRVIQDKLILSLEGTLKIRLEDGRWVTSRSCLTQTGIMFRKRQIVTQDAVVAIAYLAPFSQDYFALRSVMACAQDGLHYGHPNEHLLIERLRLIRQQRTPPKETRRMLRDLLVPEELQNRVFQAFDPRIMQVVETIRTSLGQNLALAELARLVHLSESRLEKLFKDQLRLPITQYRLRYRLYIGVVLLALGYSITQAAMAAGFASSAHFSKTFSAVNGIPPSMPFFKTPGIETFVGQDVLRMVQAFKHLAIPSVGAQSHAL